MKLLILWILLRVTDSQPILQPPTFHVCPNEIVTYTCYDRQIVAMYWIAEPYITAFDPITYTASTAPLDLGSPPINHTNHFYASLLNITHYNMTAEMGDLTTSLIVITHGLENGTNITCQTTRKRNMITLKSTSTSTIYFSDVPYWKNSSITYHQENETYFTAVLQLGDMFDGGGVPIDHYIIQVDNNTQLETTDHTYSVDVMYNDTLFVNISAHNCAGYSDLISLTLEYNPDSPGPDMPEIPQLYILISIIAVIIIFIILVTLLCLYKVYQKCTKQRSKKVVCSESNAARHDGDAYDEVELEHINNTSSVDYSYVTVPTRDCTGQYSTVSHAKHSMSSNNNIVGMYGEVGLQTCPAQPQATADDSEYSLPFDALSKIRAPKSRKSSPPQSPPHLPPLPLPLEPMTHDDDDDDIHPLDKKINGHLILLQMVPVQPYWRSLGSAAHLGAETLDKINAELGDDSERLTEVVFKWLELKPDAKWSDVASLCQMTGFNDIAEGIHKAYTSGVLPVEDNPKVPCSELDQVEAPALPPRDGARSPPPPPLPPPLSPEDI